MHPQEIRESACADYVATGRKHFGGILALSQAIAFGAEHLPDRGGVGLALDLVRMVVAFGL